MSNFIVGLVFVADGECLGIMSTMECHQWQNYVFTFKNKEIGVAISRLSSN